MGHEDMIEDHERLRNGVLAADREMSDIVSRWRVRDTATIDIPGELTGMEKAIV